MSTLIQSFQLKTKGPSFTEIIPGNQIIIRQLNQLILYNPQLRKIVKEFKLDECYFGQPATYFNSHYYELNDNGIVSISVITGASEQLALSKQLFPQCFLNRNQYILVGSEGKIYCVDVFDLQVEELADFPYTSHVVQEEFQTVSAQAGN